MYRLRKRPDSCESVFVADNVRRMKPTNRPEFALARPTRKGDTPVTAPACRARVGA